MKDSSPITAFRVFLQTFHVDLGEPMEILILFLSACQTHILCFLFFLPLFRCSSWSWHRWSTEMQIWQRWQPWGHVRGNLWRLPAQGPTRYLHMSIQSPLFRVFLYTVLILHSVQMCRKCLHMCSKSITYINSL